MSRAGNDIYVALLRGINVGGRNRLPMERLNAAFVECGCRDVRTYIQSGNVVFRCDPALVDRLPERVRREVLNAAGVDSPVILRSSADLARVLEHNPFLSRDLSERVLHVLFLGDEPAPEALEHLDADRSPPDEFTVRNREVYLFLPNGAARTRLTNAYFDGRLKTTSTQRNWRTVRKLVEMTREITSP